MTRTLSVSLSLCLILSAFNFELALAESPKMGRLPDGRAFRTDGAGYQLVDHIAELEVSVDELNRQLEAMEDEIAEKDRQISKLQIGGKNVGSETAPIPAAAGSRTATESEVIALNAKVSGLERELDAARRASTCDYEARLKPLREEVAGLRQALFSAPSNDSITSIESQKRALELSLTEKAEALEEKERSLSEQGDQLTDLNIELKQAKAQVQSLKTELAKREASEKELLAALESAKNASQIVARNDTAPAYVGSSGPSSIRGVSSSVSRGMLSSKAPSVSSSSVKSEFKKRLGDIQSLILKRKDLFDSLRGKSKGVTITLQNLVTQRGTSLDTLRSMSKSAEDERTLRTVRLGLSEIQQLLQDDIRTMERLRKL